ncbi:MAG: PH domain-containing protein [Erysipelotrichaceae bacterium]
MKVKSTVDLWFKIIVFSTIAIMVGASAIVPIQERWISIAVSVPIIGLLVWIYFGTYYELRQEYLYCKSGPFREKIYYHNIKSVRLSHNLLSSMALSSKRLEIRQHGKGYFMGTTEISPENREQFMEELKKRCMQLEESRETSR